MREKLEALSTNSQNSNNIMEISMFAKELLKGLDFYFISIIALIEIWILIRPDDNSYDNEDTKSSFMSNANKSTLQIMEKTPSCKFNNN